MRTFLLVPLALLAGTAFGQATSPDDPITTARPSFSDSPTIVPVRHLQLESGLSFYRRGGEADEHYGFGEALFRYGLVPRVEIRVQLPTYTFGPGGRSPDGFDNTQLGASFYLGKFLGFDAGVIPTVAFPTGDRDLRDDRITPSFTLNLQRSMGGGSSLGSTLGQTYERHTTQSLTTLVYARPVAKKLTGFVEYAGSFEPSAQPVQYAHVGLQLLTTKTSQLDLHGGVGLNEATSHAFVGVGYSMRF